MSAESGIPTFRDRFEGFWARSDPQEVATPMAFRANPQLVWDWHVHLADTVRRAVPNAGCAAVPRCPGCRALLHPPPHIVWFGEPLTADVLDAAWAATDACDLLICIGNSPEVQPAASMPWRAKWRGAIVIEINPAATELSGSIDIALRGTAATILPELVSEFKNRYLLLTGDTLMNEDDFHNLVGAAIADQNFERIELSLREPNIFRALSVERREIRHSNFLAYLLDPIENHGLRDIVLRKFLRSVFSDQRSDRTVFDADMLDLRQVEIRREWRNIDILILLPDDVIVIENKVDSLDHSNQLARYRQTIDDAFPKRCRHYVFLTPAGADPIDHEQAEKWMNYSYTQIADVLETILALYHESIGDKVRHYLRDYLTTVKRELLMTDKLNDLALKVYLTHRAAFDFIFENRPDPASQLYPYFESALRAEGFSIGSRNKGFIRFSSEKLLKAFPRNGQGWPEKEPFLFEIDYFWNKTYAVMKAVIAPGDEALRAKLLEAVSSGLSPSIFRKPTGKQWLVFYIKKFRPFNAEEIANEEESEIKKRIAKIVSDSKVDAMAILHALETVVI